MWRRWRRLRIRRAVGLSLSLIAIAALAGLSTSCATRLPAGLPCSSNDVARTPFLKRLVQQESVAEAESKHLVKGVPFGALAENWSALKARMQAGDQLWRFTSEPNKYPQGALEGYVVLRRCEIVDRLVLVTD